eukprot:SAG11_NODE_429_length_9534_cov_14.689242_2_plen_66_part_00
MEKFHYISYGKVPPQIVRYSRRFGSENSDTAVTFHKSVQRSKRVQLVYVPVVYFISMLCTHFLYF